MTTEQSADDTLLNDVFSSGRDRGADLAAPSEPTPETKEPEPKVEPEKQAEPEAKEKTEADSSETEPKGYRDPSTGRFVPLKELTTEREKRQAAERAREDEARLRKDAEDNWRRTQAQVEEIQRRIQASQPQQPQVQPPDPLLDPAGALAYQQDVFQQRLLNERLNTSEMFARNKHGDQIVDAAFQAAQQAGALSHFARSKDCYGDMIKWHRHQQVLARVGEDPDAYEKSLEEKIRAKVLEELKTGNRAVVPGQTPQLAQPKFPGSLVDATGTGAGAAQPISDEAMMGSVFGSDRKRR